MTQFLNSPITAEEIKKAIQKLKCKRAAGVDGISAEFYKYGCNELLPALALLFNTILTNGEYPSRWVTGIIHPVHKKGDHGVPDNYRKITVMPCIGKLFESILNNRLSFKNEVCNDNDPYQAGFKTNSRTTDNIFILCAIIDKQRCLSKPLYTCFVDFTKTFDYIDRTALYYKLLNRGIDGNLLNIIKSMFSKAECRVKWDSRISDILKSGFKTNSRTTDNIFILCAIIDKQRCLSKPLYTCFVDFTKTFDYIDRTALYYKLLNRGIDGNLLNIIKSMFSKAECRVKWDSRISDILKSEFGVLQGGMLSPKLFTEFLQDISASFDQDQGIAVDTLLIVYLLFADDLVLFSESAEGLQKQLAALYSYASLWHIIVSIPKTKV